MKLEQQVTGLEISKRLKELGVDQYEAAFKWQKGYFFIECVSDPKTNKVEETGWKVKDNGAIYTTGQEVFKWWYPEVQRIESEQYAAFTVAELGEMLPLTINGVYMSIFREKCLESWDVAYGTSDKQNIWEQAETLADAMGKMLIYLIKNGLLKV